MSILAKYNAAADCFMHYHPLIKEYIASRLE